MGRSSMVTSSSSTSFPSSSSSHPLGWFKYEVFLSFRGADTRQGFTWNLYEALRDAGIFNTFLDENEIEAGAAIDGRLLKAIEESRYCVVILSSGYADSKSCLMELAAMFRLNKKIIPVFYYVEPSDVSHQTGPFEMAFSNHKNHSNSSKHVTKWRQAMSEVSGLKGFTVSHQSIKENKVIQKIVQRVGGWSNNLLHVADRPVGIASPVEDVIKLLGIKEGGVKMVGIYGMAGVGKTTLAREIHNRLLPKFERAIYMEDIKVQAKKDGLHKLQQEFISMAFKDKSLKIRNTSQGINNIKRRFRHRKKVLAILDGVDDINQLKALAGKHDWFGEGTRILITTKHGDILDEHHVDRKYEVHELDNRKSLELFSWHAFKTEKPREEYMEICKQVVKAAGGLPLALEVIGSSLSRTNDRRVWEEVVKNLKQPSCSYDRINSCLRVSYDGLRKEEKRMFLDFACFFDCVEKEHVIGVLKGCFDTPISTINALINNCLLKENKFGELYMHDLLRDMGRSIASRSRLWDQKQLVTVLDQHTHQGTQPDIEGIVLQKNSVHQEESLDVELFANMPNLRLLHLEKIDLRGNFSTMPTSLRSFQWKHCLKKILPDNFNLQEIRFLDLSASSIVQVCSDGYMSEKRVFTNLKVLDLSGCKELVKLPDLSCSTDLEKLCLQDCSKLESIPVYICSLNNLVYLNISGCKLIKNLPGEIGKLNKLVDLYLDGTEIDKLPRSVSLLQHLEALSISTGREKPRIVTESMTDHEVIIIDSEEMDHLRALLDLLGNLKKLTKLNLCDVMLEELPDSLRRLKGLEKLGVGGSLRRLPNSICELEYLHELELMSLKIEELPESICRLQNMRILRLHYCNMLKCLPESLGNLNRLVELSMIFCSSLRVLPSSIQFLEKLEILCLWGCNKLQRILPLWQLKCLDRLVVGPNFLRIGKVSGNAVKMSGTSPDNQEFRRICLLSADLYQNTWELSVTVWGQERVITLIEKDYGLGDDRWWLSLIFADDYVDLECESEDWSSYMEGPISGYPNLDLMRVIDLSDRDMQKLDESVGHLPNLKELHLSCCKNLKCLPSSLGSLTTLRMLNLSGCQSLTALPDSIGCLTNLWFLSVENSRIKEFPDTMGSLHCLSTLNMIGCAKLKGSLPFGDWKELKILFVGAEDDQGGEKINEVVPDDMAEICGYSEQLQQFRIIRFVGYIEDACSLDKWELQITTSDQERVIRVLAQYDTLVASISVSVKRWQWLRHIFPDGFVRRYKAADWAYVSRQPSLLPPNPDINLNVTPVLNLLNIDSQSLPENIADFRDKEEWPWGSSIWVEGNEERNVEVQMSYGREGRNRESRLRHVFPDDFTPQYYTRSEASASHSSPPDTAANIETTIPEEQLRDIMWGQVHYEHSGIAGSGDNPIPMDIIQSEHCIGESSKTKKQKPASLSVLLKEIYDVAVSSHITNMHAR